MCDLDLKILEYLLGNENPVNSDSIAKFCDVSKNTVRAEIVLLNQALAEEGLRILAKKSVGYQIKIMDKSHADLFLESLRQQLQNPLPGRNFSREFRAGYIIRRLLSSSGYVPMARLCGELFYFQSSVRKDFCLVDKLLQDYQLTVRLRRGYGYYIDGNEWEKRLCLLSQHKIFANLPMDMQKNEPEYTGQMEISDTGFLRKMKLREKMLRDHPDFSFKLIELPIISNYIPLAERRKKQNGNIFFSELQMRCLNMSGLPEKVRNMTDIYLKNTLIDEIDRAAFAMLLFAFRIVTGKKQLKAEEWDDIACETESLFAFLEKKSGIPLPVDENFCTLEPGNVLVEDLCVLTAEYMGDKYRIHADVRNTLELYYLFQRLLDQSMGQAFSCRVLISSTYGYQYSCYAAEEIQKQFPGFIKQAVPVAYSDLRTLKTEPSDLLLLDMREEMLPPVKAEKILWLDRINQKKRRVRSLEEYREKILEDEKRKLILKIPVRETVTGFVSMSGNRRKELRDTTFGMPFTILIRAKIRIIYI